jgi:hypothetical protein
MLQVRKADKGLGDSQGNDKYDVGGERLRCDNER